MEGVRVDATPVEGPAPPTRRSAQDRYAPPRPPDLEAVALDAIERALWYDAVRAWAITDALGSYSLEGILDEEYRVHANGRGWQIRAAKDREATAARPGAVVDFVARPVLVLDVTVLLADGREANRARIIAKSGTSMPTLSSYWSRETREFPLPLDGRTWEVWAEPELWRQDNPRSPTVEIRAEQGTGVGPITLQLAEPRGVRALVDCPESILPDDLYVRLYRLAPGERADPDALAAPAATSRSARTGECSWVDLEPGGYVAGVTWGSESRQVLAWGAVEVLDGMSEIHLAVALPDPAETRVVRVLGPDGAPVRERLSFLRQAVRESQMINRSLPSLRRSDGAYLVHLRSDEFTGAAGDFIVALHPELGRIRASLAGTGRAPIEMRFEKAVELTLAVEDWGSTGLEGKLFCSARPTDGVGTGETRTIEPDGTARFTPAQPGHSEIALWYRAGPAGSWRICERTVETAPGASRFELRVPRLYTVRIRAPGIAPGTNLLLGRTDGGACSYFAPLPASGFVEIENLPPGRYRATAAKVSREFEVPGTLDVTIE